MTIDIQAVTGLIEDAARTLVLPRFSRLTSLTPSAAVIGEEATHHQPELLRLLASDQPLWVIDPIDGTKNFAAGDGGFGIMVAYVVEGRAQAAWLVLPARRQTFVAEADSGAFVNGERIRVPSAPQESRSRGAVLVRYMPDRLGETVTAALRGRVRMTPPSGCAAIEYTDIQRFDQVGAASRKRRS